MKKIILPAILILLAGCDYEVPMSQTAASAADPALAGTWTGQSSEGKTAAMDIKTSGTDYTATYTEDGSSIILKGFAVSAAGLNLIQFELQNADNQNKYLFVKYELTSEGLSVYRLNPEVVSAKCKTTEELLGDIAVHKQNPLLFAEPLKFSRSVPQ